VGVAFPIPPLIGERNITLSLSFQKKYDFTRSWSGTSSSGDITQQYDLHQTGGLGAITPALAFEVTKKLSLGVAVNIWRNTLFQSNGFTQDVEVTSDTNPAPTISRTEYDNFSGENVVLGALWNFSRCWTLGLRYDTPFTGEADFAVNRADQGTRRLAFPATFAAGFSWRPTDRFTAALDVTCTEWDRFYVKTSDGTKISLVDASGADSVFPRTNFGITTTVRLGFEYLFIPNAPSERLNQLWSARWGLFYDQEPASDPEIDGTGTRGHGTVDSFYGASAGFGALLFQRFNVDFAYQFRFGPNVNSENFLIPDYQEDVYQHRFLVSTVVYFGRN
jgi:long-subunit fatty acid transport protein